MVLSRINVALYFGRTSARCLRSLSKSKDELVADIIALLQSPAKNVISGLNGAGGKLAGLLKTLEERAA